ncbi:transposase [Teredinibacter haidensis]|uniref:transposase n=1 Tax=Teredinibacter haidensis TaxID=2731755 RepID=UPI00163C650F|nr:transposase [Teredinibacter haidensis]
MARSIDVVFEQNGMRKRKTDFRKGVKLGARDHLIRLPKPKQCPEWMKQDDYHALPEELTITEVRIGNKILITSLLRPNDAPRNSLKELYRQRWHVELDIRNIKTTLGMETLVCRTPDMAEKEMWIYFLA